MALKDELQEFNDGVAAGYRDKDAEIRAKGGTMGRNVAEGFLEGVLDALTSPLKWLRSLL